MWNLYLNLKAANKYYSKFSTPKGIDSLIHAVMLLPAFAVKYFTGSWWLVWVIGTLVILMSLRGIQLQNAIGYVYRIQGEEAADKLLLETPILPWGKK